MEVTALILRNTPEVVRAYYLKLEQSAKEVDAMARFLKSIDCTRHTLSAFWQQNLSCFDLELSCRVKKSVLHLRRQVAGPRSAALSPLQ